MKLPRFQILTGLVGRSEKPTPPPAEPPGRSAPNACGRRKAGSEPGETKTWRCHANKWIC